MKYSLFVVTTALILLGAGCGGGTPKPTNTNVVVPVNQPIATSTPVTATSTPVQATSTPVVKPPVTTPIVKPPTTTATKTSFFVEADDSGFYPGSGTARKGSQVTVTFKVRTSNVIYNGLAIRSNKQDLGIVRGGTSKSVTFIADSNITFSSFWNTGAYRSAWTLKVK